MRSIAATSLGVSGPWRSMLASAAPWLGDSPTPASWRRRRDVRVIARRSWAATWVVEAVAIAN